jgi:hypothetical protein
MRGTGVNVVVNVSGGDVDVGRIAEDAVDGRMGVVVAVFGLGLGISAGKLQPTNRNGIKIAHLTC